MRPAETDSLQLKLIKPREARPGFPTWDLEWKNVYRISTGFNQGRQFEADKIRVQILKEVAGREPESSQQGKSYLQKLLTILIVIIIKKLNLMAQKHKIIST